MTLTDTTARAQTEAISFEFDLRHSPEKVWRALTDPVLLAEWLLPVVGLNLEPEAAFTFNAQPQPDWHLIVHCRFVEIEAHRKLSYTWVVGEMEKDGRTTKARPRIKEQVEESAGIDMFFLLQNCHTM